MNLRRALTSLIVSIAVCCGGLATAARAETIVVDPGAKVSAGRTIIGSGQNLPTLNATATWNIGANPAALIDAYYSSGQALSDQRAVARAALRWARTWVEAECGGTAPAMVRACKVAAVFDIDDTLLTNYQTLSAATPAFTFSLAAYDAAAAACSTPVIAPTKQLYLALQDMGFAMVLITGREEAMREVSAACLRQNGISGWQKFVLKQPGDTDPASRYKAKARRALERAGWRVGPSVGDQVSDMSYGALARGFLIPNPMYLIP